jgi:S-adenosylmethionine:tRNA ribosyltransferase-isomerase
MSAGESGDSGMPGWKRSLLPNNPLFLPMLVSDFDYALPDELIADRPLPTRPESRLMVISRNTGAIAHRIFRDLPGLIAPGDLLVLNRSKVIPARLFGTKQGGGARIEILLLEQRGTMIWEALAQRAIRLAAGTVVEFPEGNSCEVVEVIGEGRFIFRFSVNSNWETFLERYGMLPLPPYILRKREELPEKERQELERLDRERYQTTYANQAGSAAAPTAGLHFDERLLENLEQMGVELGEVLLHVGIDTFTPVTAGRVEDHQMKSEWCYCPPATAGQVRLRPQGGKGRVIAVGTTSCRTLESYARQGWPETAIRSELFLKPGDPFLAIQGLLTNFHLPRSTLLMLVSAFMGNELRRRAYETAVRERYRFYSYGDAMLIL